MDSGYQKQVKLLLDVLPEVAKEECFAMHGGTAINLFMRELPRLSVDIDLTYIHIKERNESISEINKALLRIKERIERADSSIKIEHKPGICKLKVLRNGTLVKIEANMIGRGVLADPTDHHLCETAQERFDAFCVVPIVPVGQLYGGKICAALDRQHPRDIFDIKILLDNEGFNDEIKNGFIYSLLCSNRPLHELLPPNLLDQRSAFANQFIGMTLIDFSYEEFEETRNDLTQVILGGLSDSDKEFLIGFNELKPDWTIYNFQDFPSVRWKILNLEKLSKNNPSKHQEQIANLRIALEYI